MDESGIESGYGRKGSVIVATRKQRRRGDMDGVALEHNHTAAQNQDEKVKRERIWTEWEYNCCRNRPHPCHCLATGVPLIRFIRGAIITKIRAVAIIAGIAYFIARRQYGWIADVIRTCKAEPWSGGTGRVFKRNPFL